MPPPSNQADIDYENYLRSQRAAPVSDDDAAYNEYLAALSGGSEAQPGGVPPKGPGKLESALRGLGQGITMGTEDELRAALAAPFSDKTYKEYRDEIRELNKSAQKENPLTYGASELGGGIASAFIPGLGVAKGASLANAAGRAALSGGLAGLGYSEKEGLEALPEAAQGAAIGGTLGSLGKLIEKPATKVAGAFAKKATGATGKQVSKFRPGAGEELLERGIVRFGSSPADIAKRAALEQAKAARDINRALRPLKTQIPQADIVNSLKGSVDNLVQAGKLEEAEKASKIINNLGELVKKSHGEKDIPIKSLEKIKRGFKANWDNPESMQARKSIYGKLQTQVEDLALKENPTLGDKFIKAKKTYGLLAPIEEAASKRAAQLSQRMLGSGLLDLGAFGVGTGGDLSPEGIMRGLATATGRHVLAPRTAASTAVTLRALGKSGARAGQALTPILTKISTPDKEKKSALQKLIDSLNSK